VFDLRNYIPVRVEGLRLVRVQTLGSMIGFWIFGCGVSAVNVFSGQSSSEPVEPRQRLRTIMAKSLIRSLPLKTRPQSAICPLPGPDIQARDVPELS